MTHIETSRVREVIRFNIVAIKEAAAKLDESSELQVLDRDLADLERCVAELKQSLAGLPFRQS